MTSAAIVTAMLPGIDMAQPEISVVIPSHGRRLRLLWLLNALEEQTLEPGRFDVHVVHDYDDPLALNALEAHPLARHGRPRADGVGDAFRCEHRRVGRAHRVAAAQCCEILGSIQP